MVLATEVVLFRILRKGVRPVPCVSQESSEWGQVLTQDGRGVKELSLTA